MHITETTPSAVRVLDASLPLVLLVDDDQRDIRVLSEALRERAVHVRLMTANDAAQAFGALRLVPKQSPPRLVILDLHLPGIRGHQVLRELVAHAPWASVPKVVLTGSVSEPDRDEVLALGAAAFFNKPRTFEGYLELAEELRRYL
jgi:CheY-like chemotaxis protein